MVIETPVRPALAPEEHQLAAEGAQQAVPLRRVRRDALPEEIHYRDDGCDIHTHCLTCPLPRCRYDEPGGLRAMLNAYRDQQIVVLRRDGEHVDQIAERFSLSRRTVFRILSSASSGLKTGIPACNRSGNGRRQTLGQETKEGVHA